MKELYISPELEILCFAPIEGIASFVPVYGTGATIDPNDISNVGDDQYWEDNSDFGDEDGSLRNP